MQPSTTIRPIRGIAAARSTLAFLRDPIAAMGRLSSRHGRLVAVGQGRLLGRREHLYALALGPEFNRLVLGDPERFRTTGQGLSGPRGSALRRIRNGLTRSRGEKHQRMRQLVAPLFQRGGIEQAWPRMVEIVEREVRPWRPGESVDLAASMRRISCGVAGDALFGLEDAGAAAAIGDELRAFAARSFSLGVLGFAYDLPGTPYAALARRAEAIEALVLEVIARRRASGATGDDAISRMIRAVDAGEGWLSEEDLVGQVTLLFAASHETTAIALTWTLLLLSQFPSVAAALREELGAELRGAPMPHDGAARLPLLDAVVKESLRLLPPVPYTIRTATTEVELPGASPSGAALPLRRGDTVLCSHYFTHHMPSLWSEPEQFRPERWSGVTRPDPAEYLPFSIAPRICIGASFATTSIKVALSLLLQRFRFEIPAGTRVDREVRVTMGVRGPLEVRLHPTDGAAPAPGGLRGTVREMVALP